MLRLYIVYLLFAGSVNAAIFPIWAALSGRWGDSVSRLGWLPVGMGLLIAGAIGVQAMKIRGGIKGGPVC